MTLTGQTSGLNIAVPVDPGITALSAPATTLVANGQPQTISV